MVVWLYKAVLVPRVTFASVIWGSKTEQVSDFKNLERLRGLVLRKAVGAMRTTPMATLEMLLGVPLLHFDIKGRAAGMLVCISYFTLLLEGNTVSSKACCAQKYAKNRHLTLWKFSDRDFEGFGTN